MAKPKTYTYNHTDLGHFLEYVRQPRAKGAGASSAAERDRSWATMSLSQVEDIAASGGYWEKGAKEMMRASADDLPHHLRPAQALPELTMSTFGVAPVIPVAMSGDPAFMRLPTPPRPSRTLSVGVNIGCSATTHAETLYQRGRAILGFLDALERTGISTQLTGYVELEGWSGQRYLMTLDVKRYGESWDAGAVAFTLACPDFFRRACFKHIERCPGFVSETHNGYGHGRDTLSRAMYDVHFPYLHQPHSMSDREMQSVVHMAFAPALAADDAPPAAVA